MSVILSIGDELCAAEQSMSGLPPKQAFQSTTPTRIGETAKRR
jgi:hypothetical protein